MYNYILQENQEGLWFDKCETYDRKYIEGLLKVFRNKYPERRYRIVRFLR